MKFWLRDTSYPVFHYISKTVSVPVFDKNVIKEFVISNYCVKVLGTTNAYGSTSRHSNFASLFMTTGISRLFSDLFKSKS